MKKEAEQHLKEMMPGLVKMLTGIMVLALARPAIHSPRVRRVVRWMLVRQGLPPDVADRSIWWLIQDTTIPLGKE
jgi:hypothetical protein